VERHIRGKWACAKCETLTRRRWPRTSSTRASRLPGLLAQVLVAKYADHLPLYRQEHLRARRPGHPRSTLAQWVGTCGVQLQPLVDALKAECSAPGAARR
jgi:transposase